MEENDRARLGVSVCSLERKPTTTVFKDYNFQSPSSSQKSSCVQSSHPLNFSVHSCSILKLSSLKFTSVA